MSQSTFADRTVLRILGEQGPSRTALITVWAWDDAVTKLQVLTAVKKLRDLGAIEVGPPDPRGEQTWQLSTHARNNPNWDWWKKEATRRGKRAGKRAQYGAKVGYKYGKKGAKEAARRSRHGAALAAWKAKEQAAAADIYRLESCASALGFDPYKLPAPGDQVISRAYSKRAKIRDTQRPLLANYNPRARDNFFWGKKKTSAPMLPVIPFEEALQRARALGKQAPLTRDQYYLVRMPAPGGRPGTMWYFLNGLRDRSFEMASGSASPKGYITRADPWRDVYNNFRAHRSPEKYSVVLLDTLENKVGGVYDYARVAATIQAKAKANPEFQVVALGHPSWDTEARLYAPYDYEVDARSLRAARKQLRQEGYAVHTGYDHASPEYPGEPRKSKKSRKARRKGKRAKANPQARENWQAQAAQLAIQFGVPIAKKIGAKRWGILMAMSVDERTDWLLNTAKMTSWLGGPAGRIGFGVWPDKIQRKVFRAVSEAMTDPQVQQATLEAAKLGGSVAQAKYGKAAANPAPMVWEERIYQNGKLYNTLHFDTLDDFFRMIDGEDPQEGNEQVYANWKGGRGSAETWYVDGTDTRWTLKFRKVQDPRRRRRR